MARGREVVDELEKRELSLRRECGLRLVQYIDALFEAIGEQGNEGFSMRLLVERFAAVRAEVRDSLDVSGEIVEALRAHEEPFGDLPLPRQPERLGERRTIGEDRALMIAVAAFGIEAAAFGERFEKRRLAAAVLANEEGDLAWLVTTIAMPVGVGGWSTGWQHESTTMVNRDR